MPNTTPQPPVRIALIGDYDPQITAHQAIPKALDLSAARLGLKVEAQWLGTEQVNSGAPLEHFDGIWCVPGSPYRNLDGALRAIRFAREQQRPFLGTCAGFQHALLEYARHVLGWSDAEHGEITPQAERAVLSPLSCALVEIRDTLYLQEGSLIAQAYATLKIDEGYHCRYGINPQCAHLLLSQDLRAVGHDAAGDLRAVELAGHPFFIGTLFQPERAALAGAIAPLVSALLNACRESRQ